MTDSSLGVRLAKEKDRDYLAGLFPSHIADWSPIVDGGVIALPLAANEDPTVEPVGPRSCATTPPPPRAQPSLGTRALTRLTMPPGSPPSIPRTSPSSSSPRMAPTTRLPAPTTCSLPTLQTSRPSKPPPASRPPRHYRGSRSSPRVSSSAASNLASVSCRPPVPARDEF